MGVHWGACVGCTGSLWGCTESLWGSLGACGVFTGDLWGALGTWRCALGRRTDPLMMPQVCPSAGHPLPTPRPAAAPWIFIFQRNLWPWELTPANGWTLQRVLLPAKPGAVEPGLQPLSDRHPGLPLPLPSAGAASGLPAQEEQVPPCKRQLRRASGWVEVGAVAGVGVGVRVQLQGRELEEAGAGAVCGVMIGRQIHHQCCGSWGSRSVSAADPQPQTQAHGNPY